MLTKLLFTFLFVVLFTQSDTRILNLKCGDTRVIQRRLHTSEKQEAPYRYRRDSTAPADLLHTNFTLEGDVHNYATIHWSGLKKSNVVFIGTFDVDTSYTITESTMWRSEDYATTFTKQTSKFDSNAILDNFALSDTDHTNIVIADSTNGIVYVTTDEGASYTMVVVGEGFDWFEFFPGNNEVMAGYNLANKTLWGSTDGGLHWFKMQDGVETYAFKQGDPNSEYHYLYIITQDQLLYTINISPSELSQTLVDENLGPLITYLNKVGDYLFVQKQEDNNVNELWVSHMGGTFRKALFPTATFVSNQEYHIVSVHNKQLLVLLSSSISSDPVGDLFLSDETGTFYTLSLNNVLTVTASGVRYADVHVVNGMNGTILANVYVPSSQATTMITFDSGAEWALVPAPPSDYCYLPDCSLNFELSLTAIVHSLQTTLFSRSSAVGVLLAIGSEGDVIPLRTTPPGLSLFVSTDGGVSWRRTHAGSWLVTFADHAGVITAVKDYYAEQTTQLEYSLDEGANWFQYTFSQEERTVGGLVTEPGEATLVDLLFAYDGDATSSEWEIVTVNYSKLLSNPCQEDDYFSWSPYNARIGRECLLGSSVSWERKKPSSVCYNGVDYEREKNISVCSCSIVDYECDWGYKHTSTTSASCTLDIAQPPNPYATTCASGVASYPITKGYRKIAGDVCVGGDSTLYEPTSVDCNKTLSIVFTSPQLKDGWAVLGQKMEFNVANTTDYYNHFIWDFGEGEQKETVLGKTIYHTFKKTGTHIVEVSTPDYAHYYSLSIIVTNQIRAGVFSHLYGAQAGAQTVFNSYLTTGNTVVNNSEDSQTTFGYTHFSVWFDTNEKTGNSDYLTQSFSFQHVFDAPGLYIMKISVVGPINTFPETFPVQVYSKLFVMELKFTQIFNITQSTTAPNTWLNQVQTAITTKLIELSLITSKTELEINIQPNSNIVYLSFSVEGSSIDFSALQSNLESIVKAGTFGISIDSYHGMVSSVRDVTDLIQVEEGDYRGYAGAIVFLVLIVLTLAFLLILSVVIIIAITRLTRKTNNHNMTTRGFNRNVYTGINVADDELEPLNADTSDDERLLPLETQVRLEGESADV